MILNALLFVLWMPNLSSIQSAELIPATGQGTTNVRTFAVRGTVRELKLDEGMIVIRHEAVPNFMPAMTMPFKVKPARLLAGLDRGDEIAFQLHVAENESWIDGIVKTGTVSAPATENGKVPVNALPAPQELGLLDCKFTNELGRAVSLNDFRGQALAITFFYTRCPLPEYCPCLSRNFKAASQKLAAMTSAPTNWHFISITFDPAFDSPAMLEAYAYSYQQEPAHWSFLTGPADKIAELARRCSVDYTLDDGAFNHNLRTLIVDASGQVQMIFPTSGDLSGQIVTEMLKAATATNQSR